MFNVDWVFLFLFQYIFIRLSIWQITLSFIKIYAVFVVVYFFMLNLVTADNFIPNVWWDEVVVYARICCLLIFGSTRIQANKAAAI